MQLTICALVNQQSNDKQQTTTHRHSRFSFNTAAPTTIVAIAMKFIDMISSVTEVFDAIMVIAVLLSIVICLDMNVLVVYVMEQQQYYLFQ